MKRLFILGILSLLSISCTENQRAKSWGGKTTLTLKEGQQLINATWKGEDLWVLTTKRPDSVAPSTHYFTEKSSFGVMEGQITFKEK